MSKIQIDEYDALNHSFIEHSFNWPVIKENAGMVDIYHGDNDPYVPLSHAQKLSISLGAEYNLVQGGQHLNAEAGYSECHFLMDRFL
jgi:predicted alpha/beta hydrolase family esterase